MLKNQINQLVVESVQEIGQEDNRKELLKADCRTPLYGPNGTLDSLSLVRVISNIEEKISGQMNKDIVIASEKAVSQRNSPFLSVESLTNFIVDLLNQEENG
jgi:hypothetical protein